MVKKIYLSDYFGKMIVTRNAIIDLFNSISQFSGKDILIDFKGIEFISRSCADEYIKRKLISDKRIKERNIPPTILAMFLLVIKQNSLNSRIISE